ncbi:glycosyltransferase family 2 protein [Cronobacter muytjensii]|uniref:glycosyltransferase family 2 protein n=1 Tax=Cronobacter muytjensii TaxID=413501 RepID=UPI0015881156|nr:glycosyltransferase family 2 protein [Cronobacter muytjensii]EKS1847072.1 glycosyltransferase family 2 protein [Cronobacter muytjensii]ELY3985815.1 glycosyltransferase family 2 protein [Cronobacter muytjensii]ELY6276233.1 glycosyltransferase family 2 protein [Cronobacter muytjensii]MEB8638407.1 glycosyltransferase family 2 protein [Cronobacter muytjensii]NUW58477.1 glycosyltransferase family 2 protein [Cronobacter muytjensii]
MKSNLVSIIMPSWNSELTIADSINSVIGQTYTNWELIITDDCSSDGTVNLLKDFANKEPRIKLFFNDKNSGAGVSRNNCIKNAKGRFIAFLDSDDMWHAEKLEKQTQFMLDNDYTLTYTHYQKINQRGEITGRIHPPTCVNYSELLKSNVIGCLTAMYDTAEIGKVYMPSIRKRQDMALWLKILEKVDYAWCLPESLALYREGHQSLSSNKIKVLASQWAFYRHYLQFNSVKSAWYFTHYVIRALKKHGI